MPRVSATDASLARAEVAALAALRETEATMRKARDRNRDPARMAAAAHKVARDRLQLRRVHLAREQADVELRNALERWWAGPRQSARCAAVRAANARPDSFGIAHVYGVAIPARAMRTLSDVRRALNFAKAHSSMEPDARTARAVAPPAVCETLGSMQNLHASEHAPLCLLARWIINAHPDDRTIREAARGFHVARHASKLVDFRRSM